MHTGNRVGALYTIAEELYFCRKKQGTQATLIHTLVQVHSSLLMSPNSATLEQILSMLLVVLECEIKTLL